MNGGITGTRVPRRRRRRKGTRGGTGTPPSGQCTRITLQKEWRTTLLSVKKIRSASELSSPRTPLTQALRPEIIPQESWVHLLGRTAAGTSAKSIHNRITTNRISSTRMPALRLLLLNTLSKLHMGENLPEDPPVLGRHVLVSLGMVGLHLSGEASHSFDTGRMLQACACTTARTGGHCQSGIVLARQRQAAVAATARRFAPQVRTRRESGWCSQNPGTHV